MATKITTRVLADNAVTDAKIADVTLTTATQSASDNTTKIATTAYVTTAIANLADSAPSTLNTLNELAAALGDDANYATTTTNAIAGKLPLAGGTITGNLKVDASFTVNGNVDTSASLGEVLQLSQTDSVGGFLWSVNRADNSYKTMSYHAANHKFYRDASNLALTLDSSSNATFTGTIASGVINAFGASGGSNLSYASNFKADGANVQITLERGNDATGWGGIGANTSNAFMVYNQSTQEKLSLTQAGNLTVAGTISSGEAVITSASATNAFIVKTNHSGNPTALQIGGSGAINGISSSNQSFTVLNVGKDTGSNNSAYFHGNVKLGGNLTHASDLAIDVPGAITLDAGTGGTGILLKDDGAQYGNLKGNSGAPTRLVIDSSSVAGYLSVAGTEYFAWNTTDIRPTANNAYDLGASGALFRNLKLGNDAFIDHAVYIGGATGAWIDSNDALVTNGRASLRGFGYNPLSLGRYNSGATAGEAGSMCEFLYGGGGVGSISITTNSTQYNTTSDVRLKDNIKTIVDGSSKIMAMNPVSHTWKANPTEDAVHGFIAQEMIDIIPEAVAGEPEDEEMMQMDYGRITPVIVAGLQDALKEIEKLKERINELENK